MARDIDRLRRREGSPIEFGPETREIESWTDAVSADLQSHDGASKEARELQLRESQRDKSVENKLPMAGMAHFRGAHRGKTTPPWRELLQAEMTNRASCRLDFNGLWIYWPRSAIWEQSIRELLACGLAGSAELPWIRCRGRANEEEKMTPASERKERSPSTNREGHRTIPATVCRTRNPHRHCGCALPVFTPTRGFTRGFTLAR